MRVLVTGSSSHLAAALLPQLCARADIEQVTGVDILPPRYTHPKFHGVRCDARSERTMRCVERHDALVHLAFVLLRGRMALDEMREINVNAGHALFLAARAAGLRRLVHVSSAAVYGRGVRLREDAPLAPLPGFAYAEHKVELEALLARDVPECVRLRPHVILGPHAHPLLRQLLRQPFYVRMPEPYPRLQCVHEDDVAHAVARSLALDVSGPYNLASSDEFTFREAIRRRRRVGVPLPRGLARAAMKVAWQVTGWGGEPAWIDGLAAALTLDCSRALHDLGWRPAHTSASLLMGDGAAGETPAGAGIRESRGDERGAA